MARSTKAGLISVAFLLSMFIPPYEEWRIPINLVCAVLSCVLGALAATRERRWWLIIPGSIVAGFALLLYVAITTP